MWQHGEQQRRLTLRSLLRAGGGLCCAKGRPRHAVVHINFPLLSRRRRASFKAARQGLLRRRLWRGVARCGLILSDGLPVRCTAGFAGVAVLLRAELRPRDMPSATARQGRRRPTRRRLRARGHFDGLARSRAVVIAREHAPRAGRTAHGIGTDGASRLISQDLAPAVLSCPVPRSRRDRTRKWRLCRVP